MTEPVEPGPRGGEGGGQESRGPESADRLHPAFRPGLVRVLLMKAVKAAFIIWVTASVVGHTPSNTALEDMLKSSKCPLVADFLCWLDS